MNKPYQYAKEDSTKITMESNIKPGVVSFLYRTAWLLTLFIFYSFENVKGNLKNKDD